jgi:transcriptional/translational regulatory protein YebC/TACO1
MIVIDKSAGDEDTVTMAALEAGASDVLADDEDTYTIYTAVEDLHQTNNALNEAGFATKDVGLTRIPTNMASPGDDDWAKIIRLYDALEDLDDTKEVFMNVEIPESAYEGID